MPPPKVDLSPNAGRQVSGADIKELRKRMGSLTQTQFGEVVGLTRQHVAQLERNYHPVVGMTRILFLWLMSVYGMDGQPPHPSIPLVIVPQGSRS